MLAIMGELSDTEYTQCIYTDVFISCRKLVAVVEVGEEQHYMNLCLVIV